MTTTIADSPPKRKSAGRLLLTVVIVVAVLFCLVAILLPNLCKAREPANKAKCASNLHQIGLAIIMYTNDNHGQYPDSFATLLVNEQITPSVFVCPSSNDSPAVAGATTRETLAEFAKPNHESYVYLGRGLTEQTATEKTVVAYEPLTNHNGDGSNVLYGDGHVDWMSAKEMKLEIPTTAPSAK